MDCEAIRAEIEELRNRRLNLLITQPPYPIFRQSVCGEQSGEEVCVALRVETQADGVRWILEMTNMREGQGGKLCKKDRDLVSQCRVGGEEIKMLKYLSDSVLPVGICRDSRGDYQFVFIPFVTCSAKKLEEDFPPVGGNMRLFQDLTTTLKVPQRFPFVAEGAIRGILFTPIVTEGITGKL